MAAYPSVNWWPGSLCTYESRLSFVVRFSAMNGISVEECARFLRVHPDGNGPLSIDEIRRLTTILGVAPPPVDDILPPSVRSVDVCRLRHARDRGERHEVRYCEACAQQGCHSYLHQLGWLSRCPFHMNELKTARGKKHTGSLVSRRVAALECVMRQYCRTWPHGADADFPARGHRRVASLARWATRAAGAARVLRGTLWESGAAAMLWAVPLDFDHAFDQLCTLEPPPKDIEPLLAEPTARWDLKTQAFGGTAKAQLDRLRACGLGFDEVLHLYVRIGAASRDPPPFVARRNAIQTQLEARHRSCRCRWKLSNIGGRLSHWTRVGPEQGPCSGLTCPYEIALRDMRSNWGRSDPAPSNRRAEEERWWFSRVSHEICDAGLLRYTQEARVTPDGRLYIDQDVWLGCEWIREAALTELFDTAVAWEMDVAFAAMNAWLDNVDRGVDPFHRNVPNSSFRLCETDDGLLLIRWMQAEGSTS